MGLVSDELDVLFLVPDGHIGGAKWMDSLLVLGIEKVEEENWNRGSGAFIQKYAPPDFLPSIRTIHCPPKNIHSVSQFLILTDLHFIQ